MAAQIIPFPKLESVKEGVLASSTPDTTPVSARRHGTANGLHVVIPIFAKQSQQTALRIVRDVCQEHNLVHPVFAGDAERPANFWATLPIPPARAESPLSVAKRVAHMIFPATELA